MNSNYSKSSVSRTWNRFEISYRIDIMIMKYYYTYVWDKEFNFDVKFLIRPTHKQKYTTDNDAIISNFFLLQRLASVFDREWRCAFRTQGKCSSWTTTQRRCSLLTGMRKPDKHTNRTSGSCILTTQISWYFTPVRVCLQMGHVTQTIPTFGSCPKRLHWRKRKQN